MSVLSFHGKRDVLCGVTDSVSKLLLQAGHDLLPVESAVVLLYFIENFFRCLIKLNKNFLAI